MSNVAQIINDIRKLARMAAKIDSTLDALHGINPDIGIRHGDPKAQARAHAKNEAEDQMEKYLDAIDLETLRRVQAIMYSGRENQPAVEIRQELASNTEAKDGVVRTIIEKRGSLDLYFDRGLDQAKAAGIDLDSF